MLCRIADLLVDIPEAGGLPPRCREYRWTGEEGADIIIRTELYAPEHYPPQISAETLAYMESGRLFAAELLKHDGLYLHASAIELDGRAYLFSAPSGTGKSTHTRLWQQLFGPAAQVFNDDKPALRRLDGTWYAYGTPWCGKDSINQNKKVPLEGICFLKQANHNAIYRISPQEAVKHLMGQTIHRFHHMENLDLLISHLSLLAQEIPMYKFENLPELDAAHMSYEAMRPDTQVTKQ